MEDLNKDTVEKGSSNLGRDVAHAPMPMLVNNASIATAAAIDAPIRHFSRKGYSVKRRCGCGGGA